MTVNATARFADQPKRNMLSEVRIFALISALCAALLAHFALAQEIPELEPEVRPAVHWRGRYCTPTGCTGAPSNPWSVAAGFGGAVLAAGWIGRRRGD